MILGIGSDLVDTKRITKTIQQFGDRFKNRVFTPDEIAFAHSRHARPIEFAKLFAAKEAFLKAIGTGLAQGITWQDLSLTREKTGQPTLVISGKALDILTNLTPQGHTAKIHVSISDQELLALAFVVIDFIKI